MATFTVTTTSSSIDGGSASELTIINTGAQQAILTYTTPRGVDSETIWPGGRSVLTPLGSSVTAVTVSGTTTLDVTSTSLATSSLGLTVRQIADDPAMTGSYAGRLTDGTQRSAASLPAAPLAFPPNSGTLPMLTTTNITTPATGTTWAVNAANTGVAAWYGPVKVTTGTQGGVPNCVYPTGNTSPSPIWWEFVTDAPVIGIQGAWFGLPYMMFVDGEAVTRIPRVPAGNSFLTINWDGVEKVRHYKIYGGNGFCPAGIRVGLAYSVWQPPALGDRPLIGWMADSYAQTGNAPQTGIPPYGIPYCTAMRLGWRLRLSADGGTGWQTVGTGATYATRVADYTGVPLNGMVWAGGINDSATGLQAAATAVLTQARTEHPGIPFWVLGPWSPSSTYEAANASKWTQLQAAAAAVSGCTFIDNRGWITGTGNSTTPVGDGNADRYIYSDNTHLVGAGTQYTSEKLVKAIMSGWGL